MPAEAIHLSALLDTLGRCPRSVRAALSGDLETAGARAGVMLVDLPYFAGIGRRLLRHALSLRQPPAPWGDLYGLIAIDWRPICRPGPVRDALFRALKRSLGAAPPPALLAGWARAYFAYTCILASPVSRLAVSAADLERARAGVFSNVRYPERFTEAVAQSLRWTGALHDYLRAGGFGEADQAALARLIPEGSIDPGAAPWPP